MGPKRASMEPTRVSMGPKTPQRTFEEVKLLLTRGANTALLPVRRRRRSEMGGLAKLLLLLAVLGRVGGQVALPDGKTRPIPRFFYPKI